uniref:Uncharacterized protein n=1 Tax=Mycena chlorophos TaxID=658473 RepID=A0ABQ0LKN9_MYCCL|nr:predicted protein [Mycena chlorophos]
MKPSDELSTSYEHRGWSMAFLGPCPSSNTQRARIVPKAKLDIQSTMSRRGTGLGPSTAFIPACRIFVAPSLQSSTSAESRFLACLACVVSVAGRPVAAFLQVETIHKHRRSNDIVVQRTQTMEARLMRTFPGFWSPINAMNIEALFLSQSNVLVGTTLRSELPQTTDGFHSLQVAVHQNHVFNDLLRQVQGGYELPFLVPAESAAAVVGRYLEGKKRRQALALYEGDEFDVDVVGIVNRVLAGGITVASDEDCATEMDASSSRLGHYAAVGPFSVDDLTNASPTALYQQRFDGIIAMPRPSRAFIDKFRPLFEDESAESGSATSQVVDEQLYTPLIILGQDSGIELSLPLPLVFQSVIHDLETVIRRYGCWPTANLIFRILLLAETATPSALYDPAFVPTRIGSNGWCFSPFRLPALFVAIERCIQRTGFWPSEDEVEEIVEDLERRTIVSMTSSTDESESEAVSTPEMSCEEGPVHKFSGFGCPGDYVWW